jgi:hypothetical protein
LTEDDVVGRVYDGSLTVVDDVRWFCWCCCGPVVVVVADVIEAEVMIMSDAADVKQLLPQLSNSFG